MSSAIEYTTVVAGQDIYPDYTVRDDNGDLIDPATVEFRLRLGDSEVSAIFTLADGDIERVSQGFYRLHLDTTDYGDNWLWGQWLTTGPATSNDWQAYVLGTAA